MVLNFSTVSRLRPLIFTVGILFLFYSVHRVTRTPPTSTPHHIEPEPDPYSNPYDSSSANSPDQPPSKPPELTAVELIPLSLSLRDSISVYGFIRGLSAFPSDNLTKHLVVPHISSDDVSWIQLLPSWLNIVPKIYIADPTPTTPAHLLRVPRNKGNEAMTYLTYIITHYTSLPDLIIFVHAHATAWHDNSLHYSSTPLMLRELNYLRAQKQGYMNLRCHWVPGCPDWIQPHGTGSHAWKHEETLIGDVFSVLFRSEPVSTVPDVLASACCAQFVVTRDRILQNSLNEYMRWRQWLMDTEIASRYSGRVMEYLWHYMFSPRELRQPVVCPEEHVCFCDGYGICFGTQEEYDTFMMFRYETDRIEETIKLAVKQGPSVGDDLRARERDLREMGRDVKARKERMRVWLEEARRKGRDPEERRREVGETEFSG